MAEVLPATVDQVDAWRSLRRDGILRFPEAFMLTLAEHDASNRTEDIARLNCGGRFMAWEERIPVGMIALNPYSLPSMRHRAGIGPLYVTPDFQGTGVARHLLESVLSYARNAGHWQLELTVNEANTRACGFYQREGFTRYGRLPNAVIGANGPEHDLLMLRILPHPS